MINKVAFTGRETMLTKGIEKAAEKLETKFVKPYTILEPLPKVEQKIERAVYTSPFANIVPQPAVQAPVINRAGLDFFA